MGSVAAAPELSAVVAHGLSCSAACGIFLEEESNSSPVLAGNFFFFLTTEPLILLCICQVSSYSEYKEQHYKVLAENIISIRHRVGGFFFKVRFKKQNF